MALGILGTAIMGISSLFLVASAEEARAAERTLLAGVARDRVEAMLALPQGELRDGSDDVELDLGRKHHRYERRWTVRRDGIEPGILVIEVTALGAERGRRGTRQCIRLGALRTGPLTETRRDF